ncbi:MAG: hypothetical protein M3437_14155 [Chloroflexota bacterium]|nr:hypothetical protein [Chloroflexota bacterium]MDQ5866391.1 hypothetical protein [Chloroflexota bacterium]
MSNQGQVNVNVGPDGSNRNQNQLLLLGGIGLALVVVGLLFFLLRPGSDGQASLRPTPTVAAGIISTQDTGTTPEVGQQATLSVGEGQPSPTAAPTQPSMPESTPTELPTPAVAEPTRTATALEQQIIDALRASQAGPNIRAVRENGPDILEIDFNIPRGDSQLQTKVNAQLQVRHILVTLQALPLDLGRVTISGYYDLPGQPNAVPVKLDYLSDVIKETEWATMPSVEIYGQADLQAVDDDFK